MTESPGVALLGAVSVFVVRDVADSLAYYRDVLGFHVEFTYGDKRETRTPRFLIALISPA